MTLFCRPKMASDVDQSKTKERPTHLRKKNTRVKKKNKEASFKFLTAKCKVEARAVVNQQIGTTKIPNSRARLRNPGMQTRNSATFTGEGIRRTLVAC